MCCLILLASAMTFLLIAETTTRHSFGSFATRPLMDPDREPMVAIRQRKRMNCAAARGEDFLSRLSYVRAVMACVVAVAASALPAKAQNTSATPAEQGWPSRFITLVVPFGPGSGSDLVAR